MELLSWIKINWIRVSVVDAEPTAFDLQQDNLGATLCTY